MKFNLSNVKLSYRDKIAGTKLPTETSPELAELIGILTGDGHVAPYGGQNNNRVSIAGHLRDDYQYLHYVNNLIESLFSIRFGLCLKEKITSIELHKRSQGISQFLTAIGYQKIRGIMKVPDWVWDNEEYTVAFIRGLFDTDGSLCLKKNHGRFEFYPVIDITSKDEKIIRRVAKWALENNIPNYVGRSNQFDKRTNKTYSKFKLQVSGYKNVGKWIGIIGTSNPTKKEKMGVARFELAILP